MVSGPITCPRPRMLALAACKGQAGLGLLSRLSMCVWSYVLCTPAPVQPLPRSFRLRTPHVPHSYIPVWLLEARVMGVGPSQPPLTPCSPPL